MQPSKANHDHATMRSSKESAGTWLLGEEWEGDDLENVGGDGDNPGHAMFRLLQRFEVIEEDMIFSGRDGVARPHQRNDSVLDAQIGSHVAPNVE